MTAPQHSHRRHCSPLQTALWSVVCQVSSETDDYVGNGWIVTQRAQTHWRAGTRNKLGLDFALCCRAMGARPHLILVRALYQLYIRQIIFPKPLPFLATPLPELLACEILYHFGDEELDAAKVVWLWPGIRADILLDRLMGKMARQRAQAAMERLEERGYVALWSGFWWFTGRNPSMLSPSSRARFKWSDQIP